MTTETELIEAFSNMSIDAQAVLTALVAYGTGSGNINITLANGVTYSIQALSTQIAQWAAQQNTDRLNFHKDFGGAVASETVTRDAFGIITGCTAVFSSGWSMVHTYTRNSFGLLASISVVIKNDQNVTQATFSKTITYDSNNMFQSLT